MPLQKEALEKSLGEQTTAESKTKTKNLGASAILHGRWLFLLSTPLEGSTVLTSSAAKELGDGEAATARPKIRYG